MFLDQFLIAAYPFISARDKQLKKHTIHTGLLFAIALGAAACSSDLDKKSEQQLSLLLVVIDTLRADRLGVYGHGEPTSPELDRFSQAAVVYEHTVAPAPFTMPSMAAMFTGLYPDRTGVVNHSVHDRLTQSPEPTLAELASRAGYQTAAVVTNPWLSDPKMGFNRGFTTWVTEDDQGRRGRLLGAQRVTDLARGVLQSLDQQPFVLWVHYLDPHMPYKPPQAHAQALGNASGTSAVVRDFVEGTRTKQEIYFEGDYSDAELEATRRLYAAEVRFVDEQVGRLLDELTAMGRDGDTIVVVVSDHGESLGEHNLFFAHDFTLYEELLRVALIVRKPGQPAGRVSTPVSLVDLLPSLSHWMQLGSTANADGRRLPIPSDRVDVGQRYLFAAAAPPRKQMPGFPRHHVPGINGRWTMVRYRDLKLIHIPGRDQPIWEAYDLSADPQELTNVWDREGGFADLQTALVAWEREMHLARPPRADDGPAIDKRTRKELRSLGYVE